MLIQCKENVKMMVNSGKAPEWPRIDDNSIWLYSANKQRTASMVQSGGSGGNLDV